MVQLIFASKNPGKIREVNAIFQNTPWNLISLLDLKEPPGIIEDGKTFEENAVKKASIIHEFFRLPVISDDSGLAVEQLDWGPGVYSARFAGDNASDSDNNNKLISSLIDLPEPHIAKYVCCAVFLNTSGFFIETGEIYGRITLQGRGHNGFGYDPYFIPDGFQKTMAELNPVEKNRISHRAIAFNKLKMKMMER